MLGACAPKNPPEPFRPYTLTFLADFNVDGAAGNARAEEERLGGISAIAYDETTGHWFALSDARVRSRFFELSVVYDGRGLEVTPVAVTRFREPDGAPFAENVLDPEGLAETPWGTLVISTEPDARQQPIEQSKLLEFDTTGRLLRTFALPEKFLTRGWPPRKGARNNLGFESLTLIPDGTRLFVAAEASLFQDGPEVSFERPAWCRIVEYRVEDEELQPFAEYAYPLGPLTRPDDLDDVDVESGLVELVAMSASTLLALERDFMQERSGKRRGVNRSRIFVVDLTGATDVASVESLEEENGWTSVRKELLLDLDEIVPYLSSGFRRLDNFEAMGLGPKLPDGGRSLLVVSDDNFSDRQRSAFLLFSLKAVNE